jgi:hypothetical protein
LIRANGEDAVLLQVILDLYERYSGQVISKDKPAVTFNANSTAGKDIWGCLYVGKSKKRKFAYVKDRIWQQIKGLKKDYYLRLEMRC